MFNNNKQDYDVGSGSFLRGSPELAGARKRDESHLAGWDLVCVCEIQSGFTTLRSHTRRADPGWRGGSAHEKGAGWQDTDHRGWRCGHQHFIPLSCLFFLFLLHLHPPSCSPALTWAVLELSLLGILEPPQGGTGGVSGEGVGSVSPSLFNLRFSFPQNKVY